MPTTRMPPRARARSLHRSDSRYRRHADLRRIGYFPRNKTQRLILFGQPVERDRAEIVGHDARHGARTGGEGGVLHVDGHQIDHHVLLLERGQQLPERNRHVTLLAVVGQIQRQRLHPHRFALTVERQRREVEILVVEILFDHARSPGAGSLIDAAQHPVVGRDRKGARNAEIGILAAHLLRERKGLFRTVDLRTRLDGERRRQRLVSGIGFGDGQSRQSSLRVGREHAPRLIDGSRPRSVGRDRKQDFAPFRIEDIAFGPLHVERHGLGGFLRDVDRRGIVSGGNDYFGLPYLGRRIRLGMKPHRRRVVFDFEPAGFGLRRTPSAGRIDVDRDRSASRTEYRRPFREGQLHLPAVIVVRATGTDERYRRQ